MYTEYQSDIS